LDLYINISAVLTFYLNKDIIKICKNSAIIAFFFRGGAFRIILSDKDQRRYKRV